MSEEMSNRASWVRQENHIPSARNQRVRRNKHLEVEPISQDFKGESRKTLRKLDAERLGSHGIRKMDKCAPRGTPRIIDIKNHFRKCVKLSSRQKVVPQSVKLSRKGLFPPFYTFQKLKLAICSL